MYIELVSITGDGAWHDPLLQSFLRDCERKTVRSVSNVQVRTTIDRSMHRRECATSVVQDTFFATVKTVGEHVALAHHHENVLHW